MPVNFSTIRRLQRKGVGTYTLSVIPSEDSFHTLIHIPVLHMLANGWTCDSSSSFDKLSFVYLFRNLLDLNNASSESPNDCVYFITVSFFNMFSRLAWEYVFSKLAKHCWLLPSWTRRLLTRGRLVLSAGSQTRQKYSFWEFFENFLNFLVFFWEKFRKFLYF